MVLIHSHVWVQPGKLNSQRAIHYLAHHLIRPITLVFGKGSGKVEVTILSCLSISLVKLNSTERASDAARIKAFLTNAQTMPLERVLMPPHPLV